jgi:hypothetical protein
VLRVTVFCQLHFAGTWGLSTPLPASGGRNSHGCIRNRACSGPQEDGLQDKFPIPRRQSLFAVGQLHRYRSLALQGHENEIAEVVIVCEPEQASLMMGGLHPRGSLFERPVNIDTAKQQHAEFRKVWALDASAQSLFPRGPAVSKRTFCWLFQPCQANGGAPTAFEGRARQRVVDY